jgi:hypothetical protein
MSMVRFRSIQVHACAALALAAILASPGRGQSPTDGFGAYQDTFSVQKPYNIDLSQRFEYKDSTYSCWVYHTDKGYSPETPTSGRTEMRWSTWKDQDVEHMWEADMMFEAGTAHTCVMQVKSNTGGEAMYMQVFSPGDLRIGSESGPTVISGAYGKWFNMKIAYDPKSGTGRCWIDNVLKNTHHNGSNPKNWYFKNGTYGAESFSKSHYKNIRMWMKGLQSAVLVTPGLLRTGPARLVVRLGSGGFDMARPALVLDVAGRSLRVLPAGAAVALPKEAERSR